MKNTIEINTDKQQLDIHFINEFISNSHWAKGRTLEIMQTCVDNSLNFGVYLHNKQIGYARVITDYAIFAYIMDLFITEEHRKKGYSKELMEHMLAFEKLKDIHVWMLATTDAHDLYKKFEFKGLENPEKFMALRKYQKL